MSERAKWTPGPWEWEHSVDGRRGTWVRGGKPLHEAPVAPAVARIIGRHGNTQEREANARLIALAPEMAEALRDAYNTFCEMTTDDFATGSDKLVRDRLAALLAKLEGADR